MKNEIETGFKKKSELLAKEFLGIELKEPGENDYQEKDQFALIRKLCIADASLIPLLKNILPQELLQELLDTMFMFEDIESLQDDAIKTILPFIAKKDLVVALKGARTTLRDAIVKNLPKDERKTVEEDIETCSGLTLQNQQKARMKIVGIILKLEQENEISIYRGMKYLMPRMNFLP
jgi:flagellar motor switch protein FliG